MRRLLFAVAVVQFVGLARPLLGAVQYLASRSSLASQRLAVIAALREATP